jgi:hypothetical protein
MSGRSPIDSLRRLAPVSDGEAATVFGMAGREELLAGVTRLPLGSRARLRPVTRRRRPFVIALAVVVLLGTAAAAWAILGSSAQETTSVECVIAGTDTIVPSTSGDPARDCAVTWKRDTGTSAPPLAAYDNGSGGVTVIPRDDKPQAGWKPLLSQNVALIQLQNSLDDYIAGLNASCLEAKAATALAEAKLAHFGFAGWAVSVRNSDAATTAPPATANAAPGIKSTPGMRTCVASDIVDPATQSVTLIPVGVATGPAATFEKLAHQLRPLTQSCESLPAAVAEVRSAASSLGLSESARTYELNAVKDNSLRCASVYETVGGTIFVTVRGPSG